MVHLSLLFFFLLPSQKGTARAKFEGSKVLRLLFIVHHESKSINEKHWRCGNWHSDLLCEIVKVYLAQGVVRSTLYLVQGVSGFHY